MTIMFHTMNIVSKPCFKRKNVVRLSDMTATCAHSSKKLLGQVLTVLSYFQGTQLVRYIVPTTRTWPLAGLKNRKKHKINETT